MRRRDFIAALGGAVAWPVAGRAQQGERMRRIGVLMAVANDAEGQSPARRSSIRRSGRDCRSWLGRTADTPRIGSRAGWRRR